MIAAVRIRWSDLSLEWLAAVNDLLAAIDEADPIMVEGPVRQATDRVLEVLHRVRREGEHQ